MDGKDGGINAASLAVEGVVKEGRRGKRKKEKRTRKERMSLTTNESNGVCLFPSISLLVALFFFSTVIFSFHFCVSLRGN